MNGYRKLATFTVMVPGKGPIPEVVAQRIIDELALMLEDAVRDIVDSDAYVDYQEN